MRFPLSRRPFLSALSLLVGGALLALPALPEAGVTPPSGSDSSERDEVDRILTSLPYSTELAVIDKSMTEVGIFTEFPDVFGSTTFDPTTGVLTVVYNGAAEAAAVAKFLARVDEVATKAPLKIERSDAGYSIEQRSETARQIATAGPVWAKKLGLGNIVGAEVDPETGAIVVFTSDPVGDADARRSVMVDSVPVLVQGSAQGLELQSRVDDYAPWTGGARIRHDNVTTGPAECTLGFTWRKNETGELMGSTAEHCFEETGWSSWYNWGTFVGSRYYYSTTRDTTLLRGSPLNSFSASVFVGSAVTNDIRDVDQAKTSITPGGVVALSGGISGLTVGNNVGSTFFDQSGKGPLQRTDVSTCAAGDSGSPWLTTLAGSGDAVAHGLHVGRITLNGVYQCVYVPVSAVGAALTATIATR